MLHILNFCHKRFDKRTPFGLRAASFISLALLSLPHATFNSNVRAFDIGPSLPSPRAVVKGGQIDGKRGKRNVVFSSAGENFTEHLPKFLVPETSRRSVLASFASSLSILTGVAPKVSLAADGGISTEQEEVVVALSGEAKQLYNEGRAKELQGNIAAAQRIFAKVTKMSPRFIYGWSSLGNTQVALGALDPAEDSYSTSINLCLEDREKEAQFGVRRCEDLYMLLLNRGSLRLNNGMAKEALTDLEQADELRGKPDAVILQNRARARELNGMYAGADRDYTVAISMTSNEVSPFWLRSALVKFQLGEKIGAFDLLRRVENRFPEAPEVRAAVAAMLAAKGDKEGAQRKYLEIPDKARLKFVDDSYLKEKISWPPAMIDSLSTVSKAVGDI
mmetsp:Transcript_9705/g.14204  ORF Transcript_9705/g.14204 Transcript_9705/m.14204 type:complete len:391 (-) Transcript_9705:288-1460(-)|eukprot:CAMPEP_0195524412 /NCGR_PEP_ID=MMETSP0794_2-20130614/24218_1 /TAXON_ID=515487 /ORGANISM="Stephanopyxis turris, Strain CCMP 815" /LENGTH=390 /DNA_ID=CAMNT_0040654625 /DNA_START=154 /DNA_END=1326 /DNA_ORIENTATION=+